MPRTLTLQHSTIGKKVIMALSGAIIVGFAVGHFLGNTNLYRGPEAMNGYARALHDLPLIVWSTRLVLLFAFGAHIASAFSLWRRNRSARTRPYKMRRDLATNYAARTMYWSGPILLLFLAYHLVHLTFAPAHGMDVYRNVVEGFQNPVVAGFYIVGNLALGLHIFHGLYSAFQSMGINHAKYNAIRRQVAAALATLLTLGNISFPISVLAGWVTL